MAAPTGQIPLENIIQSGEVDFSKPLEYSNLKDKTILITGGASGFGAAFFSEWASHGANVIIGDINEKAGKSLVEKVKTSTGNANLHFIKLDVTDWKSQMTFFREASKLSPHGGIDCVVANAGISGAPESARFEEPPDFSKLEDAPAPKLKTFDINLTGVTYTTILANSYLPRNPGSQKCGTRSETGPRDRHIILISSVAGVVAFPTQPLYCASKHAVVGLFRASRVTSPILHGIRVNMLCPYFVDTPLLGPARALLAGGALADISSVVGIATRLVTDYSIIGRGLMIGPKTDLPAIKAAGFDESKKYDSENAVWDIYAHDFEHGDVFSRRVLALTNLKANVRGWSGMLSDIGWAVASPIRRLVGW